MAYRKTLIREIRHPDHPDEVVDIDALWNEIYAIRRDYHWLMSLIYDHEGNPTNTYRIAGEQLGISASRVAQIRTNVVHRLWNPHRRKKYILAKPTTVTYAYA